METPPPTLNAEKLDYNKYLRIGSLLDLQHELSEPPHHDEMFFIIIHQAAELWFKEILHETEALIRGLQENNISRALKVLRRTAAIMSLQVQQINLLATLTPVEFAGFRDALKPASGFQSVQFRMMEYAYGLRDDYFLKFFESVPEAFQKLKSWKERPSVHEEFKKCLEKYAPTPDPARNMDSAESPFLAQLREIYENPGKNYHWVLLCEALLDFDEKFALWRSTHTLMIARTIGMKTGTGGSSGYSFLKTRLELRFFPELWEIRSKIGT